MPRADDAVALAPPPPTAEHLVLALLEQLVVDRRQPALVARLWASALDDFAVRACDDDEVLRLASIGRTPGADPCVVLDGPNLDIRWQDVDEPRGTKYPLYVDIATRELGCGGWSSS